MLLTVFDLSRYWGLSPSTIIHIGAHEGEELEAYDQCNWGSQRVVWIEALPDKASLLRARLAERPEQEVLNFVAWDCTGEVLTFNETENGQSSSALPLKMHAEAYPDIQVSRTLNLEARRVADSVDLGSFETIDLVNLDIQGAELRALKGFGDRIDRVRAVYSEINIRELYEGCALLPELDAWLGQAGFRRVDWELVEQGWGDALWLRSDDIPRAPGLRRRLRRSAVRRRDRRA